MGFYQAVNAIGLMTAALIAGFTYDLWNKVPFLIGGVYLAISTTLAISFYTNKNNIKENK